MTTVPFTQLECLFSCALAANKGQLWAPVGKDYRRAHALLRRGLIEPLHGRKGEGIEHYKLTADGRLYIERERSKARQHSKEK